MEDESLREILISLHKMKQKLLLREDSEVNISLLAIIYNILFITLG